MVPVLKTGVGRLTEGSNPSLSTMKNAGLFGQLFSCLSFLAISPSPPIDHPLNPCLLYSHEHTGCTFPPQSRSCYTTHMDTEQNQPQENTPDTPLDANGETELRKPVNLAEPFSWTAPEGIRVTRGMGWYVAFGTVIIVLMVLAIFVFKSWTFAILLPVMAIAIVLLSVKPPRDINYAVGPKGIHIGDKLYDYSEFKAFGVHQDSDPLSIVVLPIKRFSTGITLYFSEADGERIVDMLGARLPLQEVKHDSFEKLIRLIRL